MQPTFARLAVLDGVHIRRKCSAPGGDLFSCALPLGWFSQQGPTVGQVSGRVAEYVSDNMVRYRLRGSLFHQPEFVQHRNVQRDEDIRPRFIDLLPPCDLLRVLALV